ncbi:MAG: proprotein convertase P-domain-containing protein [Planctomycetota bacterium]|nr:proprotein convertase P-domain-containing protein [Planctomycetota bacterium]
MSTHRRLLLASTVIALSALSQAQFQGLNSFDARMASFGGPNFAYGGIPPGTSASMTNFPSLGANSNKPITDAATTSSFIDVFGVSGYMWDADVRVNLSHANSGDLDVYLVAPNGKVVTLTTDNAAGVMDAYTNTKFDDSSAQTVLDQAFAPSQSLTLVPEGALGSLMGIDPNPGLWELRVVDDTSSLTGTIVSWSLDITTLTPAPAPIDYTVSDTQSFNGTIPDNNPNGRWGYALIIDAGNQIEDVRVRVQIAHARPSDLKLTLTSPEGTQITLATARAGNTSGAYGNLEFRDDAVFAGLDAPISDFNFVLNGIPSQLVPEGALSRLAGEDASGTWYVHVVDSVAGSTGTLLGVSVSVDVWDLGGGGTGGYCTSGTSSNGCVPTLTASGTSLSVTNTEGMKVGLFFFGVNGPRYAPWGPGSTSVLCVKAPTQRMAVQISGGFAVTCTGTYFQDCAGALAAAGVTTGTTVYVQCWYRDPPAPKNTNLTNAVVLTAP